jgi:small subunit ribosomal protein S20
LNADEQTIDRKQALTPCLWPVASAEFAPHFWSQNSVANIKSAIKRARQTIQRRASNMAARSRLRTAIKNVLIAVEAGKKEEAVNNLKVAVPVIDAMVNKGIIHRNKAARHKSQLNSRVKALAG